MRDTTRIHLAPKPNARRESTPVASGAVQNTHPYGKLKILVAEDDAVSALVLEGLLKKYGEVHIAKNGTSAISAFRQARQAGPGYDLICMDIRMPELDGMEAVRQIREIEAREEKFSSAWVKIFMTTSSQSSEAVNASYQASCNAYLMKPISGSQLEEYLRAFGLIARLENF